MRFMCDLRARYMSRIRCGLCRHITILGDFRTAYGDACAIYFRVCDLGFSGFYFCVTALCHRDPIDFCVRFLRFLPISTIYVATHVWAKKKMSPLKKEHQIRKSRTPDNGGRTVYVFPQNAWLYGGAYPIRFGARVETGSAYCRRGDVGHFLRPSGI